MSSPVITFQYDVVKAQLDSGVQAISLNFDGATNLINFDPQPHVLSGTSTAAIVTYTDPNLPKKTFEPTATFEFPRSDTIITLTGGSNTEQFVKATDGKGNVATWRSTVL